jgi:hypothetical protein
MGKPQKREVDHNGAETLARLLLVSVGWNSEGSFFDACERHDQQMGDVLRVLNPIRKGAE